MTFEDALYLIYTGLGAWLIFELIRFLRRW